jgi:glycerate 2-kinase
MKDIRGFLQSLFNVAVEAAQPSRVLRPFLPAAPEGRTLVLGAGKASVAMAQVVDANWPGDLSGLVVTPKGQLSDCGRIGVLEAAHPVPDGSSVLAGKEVLKLCSGLTEQDLVLCLISGGGSSLLCLPGEGISLEDKQMLNVQLLKSGASISEINTVRKHISAIKGGRLAAACAPAKIVTLMVSDFPGDDPLLIASGPTLPDPTTASDARAVLERWGINTPESISQFLQSPEAETPDAANTIFANHTWEIVARAAQSLQAAAEAAHNQSVEVHIVSDAVEGESREVGKQHAKLAVDIKRQRGPDASPCIVLSGGETSVTVTGSGKGGRNAEYVLGVVSALQGEPGISVLACDTDGIDGSEDNAGCYADEHTLARAHQLGFDAAHYLANNDAWSFFDALGDLVITGPTGTNVNDFRAIYIGSSNA